MTAGLVVLISGNGSNLQAILDACADGGLPARVLAVISNRASAYGLERARSAGVPAHVHALKPTATAGRARNTTPISRVWSPATRPIGWCSPAGCTCSATRSSPIPDRVVNLHPALPGMFPGTDAIARALAAHRQSAVAHTGVMVHLVPDEGVDSGPVLAQQIVPIERATRSTRSRRAYTPSSTTCWSTHCEN
jgi:folate-dependent phosphoribosylglycinamide formyltransferase PurN